MRRSVMMTSKGSRCSASIADSPPSAQVMRYPSWRRVMPSTSRMLGSSSTIRRRGSGMTGRQADGEGGAEARGAADVDVASVVLDHPVHEGEPESTASRLGGVERLEDVEKILGHDSLAGV